MGGKKKHELWTQDAVFGIILIGQHSKEMLRYIIAKWLYCTDPHKA